MTALAHTDNVIPFAPRDTDSYFGGCPVCHRSDGYLNIGRGHWKVCHAHKVRWFVGENLFSTWKDETENDWRRNHDLIGAYPKVEPWYGAP